MLHQTSLVRLQSADAPLDRPCFVLERGLAQQSRLPILQGQVVSAFSLFPPDVLGSWSLVPIYSVSVGATGDGVWLKVDMRIFQASPSRRSRGSGVFGY